MGESALGRQSLLKAYQLRHRASDVERLNIETLYDRDVTGNLERERRTLETWAESYPRDSRARSLIAGLALTSTGQHELAIAETEKALSLDPDLTPTYCATGHSIELLLNRLDDALLTVRRATERKLQSPDLRLIPYSVAFLRGDDEELKRTGTVARKNPGLEDLIPHLEALALARAGRAARRETDCPRSPSRSRSARAGANGPPCSKRPEPCGKRFTAMRPPPGRAPARRSRLAGAATWTMPRRSRWRSRAICRNRAPSPTISRASSRRIRSFNSCICRRFGPCSP